MKDRRELTPRDRSRILAPILRYSIGIGMFWTGVAIAGSFVPSPPEKTIAPLVPTQSTDIDHPDQIVYRPGISSTVTGSGILSLGGEPKASPSPTPEKVNVAYDADCGFGVLNGVKYVSPLGRPDIYTCEFNYSEILPTAVYIDPNELDDFVASDHTRSAGDAYRLVILREGSTVWQSAAVKTTPRVTTTTNRPTP